MKQNFPIGQELTRRFALSSSPQQSVHFVFDFFSRFINRQKSSLEESCLFSGLSSNETCREIIAGHIVSGWLGCILRSLCPNHSVYFDFIAVVRVIINSIIIVIIFIAIF